jgi:hypothetical protein
MFLCVLSLNQFKAIDGSARLPSIHTMIYTHILQQDGDGVPSPLDGLGVWSASWKQTKRFTKCPQVCGMHWL